MNATITFNRVWAMPNCHTFLIPPIRETILKKGEVRWVDPFSGHHSLALLSLRNDLNPEVPAGFHEDAEAFVKRYNYIEGILFDPPYSPRQISECYKSVGLKVGMEETQSAALYSRVKDAAAPRIRSGGLAICCGWNSVGFGIERGFELIEILMVCHGGAHNDTIVTVERKTIDNQSNLF